MHAVLGRKTWQCARSATKLVIIGNWVTRAGSQKSLFSLTIPWQCHMPFSCRYGRFCTWNFGGDDPWSWAIDGDSAIGTDAPNIQGPTTWRLWIDLKFSKSKKRLIFFLIFCNLSVKRWFNVELLLQINFVTNEKEPHVSYWKIRMPARFLSFSVVALMTFGALGIVFGIVVYRMSIVTSNTLFGQEIHPKSYTNFAIPATIAASINLVIFY